jgi:hypothetical protein
VGVLYAGNNANRIVLKRVRDPAVSGYISDMAGTVTIYDQNDAAVSNATSVAIAFTTGSDGEYRAEIPASARLIKGTKYKAVFSSSNYDVELTKMFECVERTG